MSEKKPYWKTIKDLFSSLKKENIQKAAKITPVIATCSYEAVIIKTGLYDFFNLNQKTGNEYNYFLNIFKFEDNGVFYRCSLHVIRVGGSKDEEISEERVYNYDEVESVMGFLSTPDRIFDTVNKKKKVITFKDLELDYNEYLKFLEIWKNEKTT